MSLLSDILQRTRADLNERRLRRPLSELKLKIKDAPPPVSLMSALSNGFCIIGEIKKKSPSIGEMNPQNVEEALDVYNQYSAIGAVSVLTDVPFFGGSLERLWHVRNKTQKPILRKDFIVDEYQVDEARAFGADAILLMGTVHEEQPAQLKHLHDLAKSLGLQTLVELGMSQAGPDQQVAMIPDDAEIWGINSRQFHSSRIQFRARMSRVFGRILHQDFTTSSTRHRELRGLIPAGKLAVAESGIHKPSDLNALLDLGYNAALIGTAFLKTPERVESVVSRFADHIASLKHHSRQHQHSDLAWQRPASR